MFDLGWQEFFLIAIVAVLVVGPKDLPGVIRAAARWIRKARTVARDFQNSIEEAAREAELDDIRKEAQKISRGGLAASIRDTVDPDGDMTRTIEDTRRSIERESRIEPAASPAPPSPAPPPPEAKAEATASAPAEATATETAAATAEPAAGNGEARAPAAPEPVPEPAAMAAAPRPVSGPTAMAAAQAPAAETAAGNGEARATAPEPVPESAAMAAAQAPAEPGAAAAREG